MSKSLYDITYGNSILQYLAMTIFFLEQIDHDFLLAASFPSSDETK